ncbi:MAG: GNAT family N-acetyltransferase [Patescibacteria group bacterium]|nr:GNAT family N-acetyltransferase [Patescibacteria group bacterium]
MFQRADLKHAREIAAIATEAFQNNRWTEGYVIHTMYRYCVYVLEEGSEAIGCLMSENMGPTSAYIAGVAIRANRRRMGNGRILLKHALKRLEDEKKKTLLLHTLSTNTPAIRLYESMGFKPTGNKKKFPGGSEEIEFIRTTP